MPLARVGCLATVAATLLYGTAEAQTGLTFTGTVVDSCTVVAGTPGLLAASNGNAVLSSETLGGVPSAATITTTGLGYELSVEAPSSFDLAPADASVGTAFSAAYNTSGATIVGRLVAGVTQALALGVTLLEVDASAERSGNVFPAGAYAMTATVRCTRP